MIGGVVISVCITATVIFGIVLWQLETSANVGEAVRLLKNLVEALD